MLLKRNKCVNFTVKIHCKIKKQLYKIRQRLGAAPPHPCILDLQSVETPSKNHGYAPVYTYTHTYMHTSPAITHAAVITHAANKCTQK